MNRKFQGLSQYFTFHLMFILDSTLDLVFSKLNISRIFMTYISELIKRIFLSLTTINNKGICKKDIMNLIYENLFLESKLESLNIIFKLGMLQLIIDYIKY